MFATTEGCVASVSVITPAYTILVVNEKVKIHAKELSFKHELKAFGDMAVFLNRKVKKEASVTIKAEAVFYENSLSFHLKEIYLPDINCSYKSDSDISEEEVSHPFTSTASLSSPAGMHMKEQYDMRMKECFLYDALYSPDNGNNINVIAPPDHEIPFGFRD